MALLIKKTIDNKEFINYSVSIKVKLPYQLLVLSNKPQELKVGFPIYRKRSAAGGNV
jgi:hypothetical protein